MDLYAPFSADTQAEFYRAEAEMLRFAERAKRYPYVKYISETLMAIDAVFAVRMSSDVSVPPVALVVAYDVAGWKYGGDASRCLDANSMLFQLPAECCEATIEAISYMQALEWVSTTLQPGYRITVDTLLHLHGMLLDGSNTNLRPVGFRSGYLPHKKGASPAEIHRRVEELCAFSNGDHFSPLGQASVIHHAFERIVPFDSMIDRTGLLFSFMPMFRRGLFHDGCIVPICWGASLERDYRRKLKDASRDEPDLDSYKIYREGWAAYNARNTYMAVGIASMFLAKTEALRANWSQRVKVPANSALEGLLDLFLAIPQLSIRHAASCIGKSYGATNEAMHRLVKAGIVEEVPLDNRERVFICKQSAELVAGFVEDLERTAATASRGRDPAPKSH